MKYYSIGEFVDKIGKRANKAKKIIKELMEDDSSEKS